MAVKLVNYSVLTLMRRRDIIIKSPREIAKNSESAGAAWNKRLIATTKNLRNFKKGIDKEKFL